MKKLKKKLDIKGLDMNGLSMKDLDMKDLDAKGTNIRKSHISRYWNTKAFVVSMLISALLIFIIWLLMHEKISLHSVISRSIASGIFMLMSTILIKLFSFIFGMATMDRMFYTITFLSYFILFYWCVYHYDKIPSDKSKRKFIIIFVSIYLIVAFIGSMIYILRYYLP